MFSKLSGRTKTQEIEKPQSFASQLAEATKLFYRCGKQAKEYQ